MLCCHSRIRCLDHNQPAASRGVGEYESKPAQQLTPPESTRATDIVRLPRSGQGIGYGQAKIPSLLNDFVLRTWSTVCNKKQKVSVFQVLRESVFCFFACIVFKDESFFHSRYYIRYHAVSAHGLVSASCIHIAVFCFAP